MAPTTHYPPPPETCRDLGHTSMGMGAMFNAVETARLQGLDLLHAASGTVPVGGYFSLRVKRGGRGHGSVGCGTGGRMGLNKLGHILP